MVSRFCTGGASRQYFSSHMLYVIIMIPLERSQLLIDIVELRLMCPLERQVPALACESLTVTAYEQGKHEEGGLVVVRPCGLVTLSLL